MSKITRALISVHDKDNIVEFAKVLATLRVEILSTGGTAKILRDAGVDVVEVSDYTGSPEVFEGRLKTLHPKIHGGILYRRENPGHVEQANANGIGPIDMVVVNLYPFERVTSDQSCSFDDAIENIDIGGPTMLRAAAKNHRDVAVVVDPMDYDTVAKELMDSGGELSPETCLRLAKKAFAVSARYDCAIATYLGGRDDHGGVTAEMPQTVGLVYEKLMDLRYGENPHQRGAFYRNVRIAKEPCIVNSRQLQGKELSYNNIMDADAAIELIKDLRDWPCACAIMKHANPCGVAVSSSSLAEAFEHAKECDPLSAFGGIIGVNRSVDENLAASIAETFFEVVIAPGYDDRSLEILGKKKNLRVIEVPNLVEAFGLQGFNLRNVTGGILLQDRDLNSLNVQQSEVVTRRKPTEAEWAGLNFAWRVVKHIKSNAILFTTSDRTLGVGAGQMSRVDSTKIAIMKARVSLKGSCVASDAFFPFRDGVDVAADAGATAIVQPGGSIRDEEVIAAADEHDMAMVFTGERHFRH